MWHNYGSDVGLLLFKHAQVVKRKPHIFRVEMKVGLNHINQPVTRLLRFIEQ